LLEGRAGADPARYRTRNFVNDFVYAVFYKGPFYYVLLLAAVTNALEPRLNFLQLNLLRGLPWPVGLAIFWIGGDFLSYWWHRLQHSNRFLWAFHSVHHSQEQLTSLTAWRRHPLEDLIMDVLLYFLPFQVLLGIPTRGWVPLAALLTGLQLLHHSQLDWDYGRLGRWVVSPHFHAFHHSVDRLQADSNFGLMFSCWDHLFGTATDAPGKPRRYGVDGIEFQESLVSQLVMPFRLAWRWRRAGSPPVEPVPHRPHPSES
jgi:sterol desaturase/sphingolipid hydroxylase (fatty acid hydroxylase superfamily)